MDYTDRKNKKYQAKTTKLLFARMSVPVHATNCIFIYINGKKGLLSVKQYAVQNAKIRQ